MDAAIARLAAGQHGVVSRAQLVALGLGRGAIDRRLARKRLHRVHRGVYAVGHSVLSREARWMAAVLAGGEGAVLSHWSAAHLWQLRPGGGPRSHVTVPAHRRPRLGNAAGRRPVAIAFHSAGLPRDEVTVMDAVPVTTPGRTLLDLAPLVPSPSLARAVERVESLRLNAGTPLADLLDRYPGRPGTPKLTRILATPIPRTRSELEARFFEFLHDHGLPKPEVNALIELPGRRIEVDFAWRSERLAVELDVYATHGTTFAFERDRARDRALQAAGWTVTRVTDNQLDTEPTAVAADLSRLLAASAARSPSRHAAAW